MKRIKIANITDNAVKDVNPDDVKDVVVKTIKIIKDLLK